jgi:hypothetical protein
LAPEIALNYHGRFQQLEGEDALFEQMPISGLISSDDDPNANRLALIDIEISIEDGRLLFTFLYNRHMTKQSLLENGSSTAKIRWVRSSHFTNIKAHNTRLRFPSFQG